MHLSAGDTVHFAGSDPHSPGRGAALATRGTGEVLMRWEMNREIWIAQPKKPLDSVSRKVP